MVPVVSQAIPVTQINKDLLNSIQKGGILKKSNNEIPAAATPPPTSNLNAAVALSQSLNKLRASFGDDDDDNDEEEKEIIRLFDEMCNKENGYVKIVDGKRECNKCGTGKLNKTKDGCEPKAEVPLEQPMTSLVPVAPPIAPSVPVIRPEPPAVSIPPPPAPVDLLKSIQKGKKLTKICPKTQYRNANNECINCENNKVQDDKGTGCKEKEEEKGLLAEIQKGKTLSKPNLIMCKENQYYDIKKKKCIDKFIFNTSLAKAAATRSGNNSPENSDVDDSDSDWDE